MQDFYDFEQLKLQTIFAYIGLTYWIWNMTTEEKANIEAAQRGNFAAFEALVRKYDKQVMQLTFSMVRNTEDTEDVYQEVFLRVYKSLGRFRFQSEFSTWLYRIVVNSCINFVKKKKRAQLFSLDNGPEADSENWRFTFADKGKSPEEWLLNQELSQEIEYGLEAMSPKQKMVFVLRHYYGKKLKEIAAMMDCSEGTIKNSLFRATQKMQHHLRDYVRAGA